ncbi:MAG: phosphorylase [Acidobacteriota bacterium]|nr:phosphorylase [Acidobacteriota bacterium]
MRVGIIAALPREVAALVQGWQRRQGPDGVVVYTDGGAVVACAGMGAARAELAVVAAMATIPLTRLVSVGLAGACDPALHVGEIVRAGIVIDSRTSERFEDDRYQQVLVTTDAIASVGQKESLRRLYKAAAVDMEASAVGRLASEHGLGFSAIKAISDEADFEIVNLESFATADGQFREGAFALHAALHPAMWGKVIALGRNSSKALAALTKALRAELDWYRQRA